MAYAFVTLFLIFWGFMFVLFLVVNLIDGIDYDSFGSKVLKSAVRSFFFIIFFLIFYCISELLHLDLEEDIIIGAIIFIALFSVYLYLFLKKDSY
jgi:amino acid permease